VTRDNKTTA